MSEIDEFLQHVFADRREWDADPKPQTPVYALLTAGRLEEAETVARQMVLDLEGDLATSISALERERA